MSGEGARLLLDEMFAPQIAEALRRRGHDVVALVADPELRALPDPEVYEWAGGQRRRVVTENVKDFRVLVAPGTGPECCSQAAAAFHAVAATSARSWTPSTSGSSLPSPRRVPSRTG